MTRDDVLTFLRKHPLAVSASVTEGGAPEAALVRFAVTDDLEILFDTRKTARKAVNLQKNPRVALVVGWDHSQTMQVEGVADEPAGAELERLKSLYFAAWPDAPELAGNRSMTYFRVRLTWARHTDVEGGPPRVTELDGDALAPRPRG